MMNTGWCYPGFLSIISNILNLYYYRGREEKLEERKKFGIDYDDDYNYLQHMKTRTDCMLEPLPDNVTVIEKQKEKNKVQVHVHCIATYKIIVVWYHQGCLNLKRPPDLDCD